MADQTFEVKLDVLGCFQSIRRSMRFWKITEACDDLAILEGAITKYMRSHQWQPIDSAPKDGTTLALFGRWFGDPEVRIGQWLSSPIDGYDGDWSIEYEPTHYIVIPALPTPLLADPQEQSGSAG